MHLSMRERLMNQWDESFARGDLRASTSVNLISDLSSMEMLPLGVAKWPSLGNRLYRG